MSVLILNSTPFNPSRFLEMNGMDPTWSIVEQDAQSLILSKIDMDKVTLETMFTSNENVIGGEERMHRLKEANYTRLDARVFLTLWENHILIPESWKKYLAVYFDGTILFDSRGRRHTFCLRWCSLWLWNYSSLDCDFIDKEPSACLKR